MRGDDELMELRIRFKNGSWRDGEVLDEISVMFACLLSPNSGRWEAFS